MQLDLSKIPGISLFARANTIMGECEATGIKWLQAILLTRITLLAI